jgi:hypothetical protein
MPNPPAERLPRHAKMLRHDSLRQLNLNQLTHLSREERPPNRAEKGHFGILLRQTTAS